MVVQTALKDGLMLPSGFTAPSSYRCVVFCRTPADLSEDDLLEAIFERLYGKTWRAGNDDGSRYVVQSVESRILTPEEEGKAPWLGVTNTKEDHYWFYHVTAGGELESVTATVF